MAPTPPPHSIFRTALLAESALNLSSMIPMLVAPETVLSFIVASPSETTPLSRSLLRWIAALLTLATAPLLLAYPNPSDDSERAAVLARRRLAYAIMSISEVVIASTTAWQYVAGGSGIRGSVLLIATATVGGLGLLRGWVLLVKGQWMEPRTSERKTK